MEDKKSYQYNPNTAESQLAYLQALEENNNSRRDAIEGKLLHMSRSSGIVVSLVGIMVTLFYDKLIILDIGARILVAFVFVLTIIFFFISIFRSRKTLNIKKYPYVTGSVKTIKKNHSSQDELRKEEIEDLLFSIPCNTRILNDKGTDLIRSHEFYNIGLYGIGTLVALLMLFSFYLPDSTEEEREVEKLQIEVKLIDVDSIRAEMNIVE